MLFYINYSKFEKIKYFSRLIDSILCLNKFLYDFSKQKMNLFFRAFKFCQRGRCKQINVSYSAKNDIISNNKRACPYSLIKFYFYARNSIIIFYINPYFQQGIHIQYSDLDRMENQVSRTNNPQAPIANIDKKQEKQSQFVSFWQLFRFADSYEYLLLVLGVIFALIAGCSFPWFAFLWGRILDAFLNANNGQARLDDAIHYRNIFFYVGIGALFSSWIAFVSWTILSERLSTKCRKACMNSLLRQDVGWFDQQDQFHLSNQFNFDALAFQKGTGQKIGIMLTIIAMFACGTTIAVAVRWTMALVVMAILPIIGIGCFLFIYLIHRKNQTFQELYEQADISAYQALSSIKTVKSMNGEQFEETRYSKYLQVAKQNVVKWALLAGLGTGLFFFIQYCAICFGFWYGTHCVAGSNRCPPSVTGSVYTPGEVTLVFFTIFIGSYYFLQLVPNIMAIIEGLKAAKRLYKIIDLQPIIIKNSSGIKKVKLEGKLVFENVTFSYPTQKNKPILKKLNLVIEQGAINTFVGDSGCGKSTVVQLIMRFYDPDEGRITLDGVDLREYDLEWLRYQIGYVGQEPCLFEGSIKDNIRIGKNNATDEQIREALQRAGALDFVEKLNGKLDYNVGYAGSQLSGGQKQRIAIARAILRKPQILILDEATSSLDRRNQKLIQSTLDNISKGITTITTAHRIKTIRNSNKIFVLNQGKVFESGKFKELNRFKQLEIEIDSREQIEPNQILNENKRKNLPALTVLRKSQSARFEAKDETYKGSVYGRLLSYTDGSRCKLAIALLACIMVGAAHPGAALLLANIINEEFRIYINSSVSTAIPQIGNDLSSAENYVLGLFLLAIFIFFVYLIQASLFTFIGQQVTEKIRMEVYHKLLRLPVSWFQSSRNSGGTAATRFGVDSRQVNGLATSLLSTHVMNFSSIVFGLILSFTFEWRIGLAGLIAMPCMIVAGFMSRIFYTGFGDNNMKYYEESSKISQEAILNIRTVYSNNHEIRLEEIYNEKLQYPLDTAFLKGTKLGLLYGFSQLIIFFTFGVLFYFGALIMRDNSDVTLLEILCSILVITWVGWCAGNTFYFFSNIDSSRQSAQNLFKILDAEDEDQIQIKEGSRLQKTPIDGTIEFIDVSFKYERHGELILKLINMKFNRGEKIALVGPWGCGKSTLMQLLQRFYEYDGIILVDNVDIRDYDVHFLREHFACVSQESSLFTGTIGENITYNSKLNQSQLKEVATKAEALSFIQQNQQGFNREVGVMGSHLLEGQKQRVAIARALARNPQILLLDNATSALDRETEKRVQRNINESLRNKTSLIVAHRLQTIIDADRIYLFDKGQILEQGNYKQLMEQKRYFYSLERGEQLQNE